MIACLVFGSIRLDQSTSAQAKLNTAESDRRELEVLQAEVIRLEHRAREIELKMERQQLDIADRAIRSPLAGVVSRTFVTAGEYVTPASGSPSCTIRRTSGWKR